MNEQRVVRTYFLLSGTYMLAASLIWAINTLFLLNAGLSIGEVFFANGIFSLGMVLFEVPTGVVADTLGRRVSYLFSVAVLLVTTVLYLVMAMSHQGVVAFSVVSLFLGLGFTFYSGALEAWLVDALADVGGTTTLDVIFARGQKVTGAAMLAGTIGGGALGQFDLAAPFVARAVLLLLLFGLSWSVMHDQGFTPRRVALRDLPGEMATQARVGITFGWQRPGLRALMLTGALRSGFLFWGFYAAQPYFLELLERDAVWVVGLTTAGLSIAMMAGNQTVEWASRRCRRRSTLLLWAGSVASLATIAMGVVDTFWPALAAFFVVGASSGVAEPVHRAYLHTVTPSEQRATVASFDSMVGSTGGATGQIGLGAVSGAQGFGVGYLTGGLATLLALPLLWAVRRAGGDGDRIVGMDPEEASCAAEGLPSIALVTAERPASAE